MDLRNIWSILRPFTAYGLLLFACGCTSLLPEAHDRINSPWESFAQAKSAFDTIEPYRTTQQELMALNFAPLDTPNVKILNYLDIISRFMPNASITKDDLDPGVRQCIDGKDDCQAYEIAIYKHDSKRYGNVFLDLFKFERQVHRTGWNFWALIVLHQGVVVYKVWGGQPNMDFDQYEKNPLGPLQEPAGMATDAALRGIL